MMKKLISLTLAAAMTMSLLAGCGSNSSAGTDSADASAETFKIGGIGPITGAGAVYGIAVKNGAELAIKEINEAGGINGYQIEYNFQDDELDNEKSVNAYNTLKDWGMNMLVGSVTSGCCVAVAAESKNDNMFQITPSGSSVDCIEGNDNVFQVCFTDPNQGVGAADYIGGNNLASKVAVIYDSSDVYSSGIYAKFKEEAATQNFEIVSEEAFTADNKTDFSVQLAKAQEAGAELVFLPIYYTEASLILKQADSMGYAPKFFGCDGLDGILGVENFDTSLAEGVMLLTPFAADAQDDLTKKFVSAYETAYNDTPNQFAADAYDAVYAIKAAAEKGDVAPSDGVSGICDKMKAAMQEITVDGLTGEGMNWAADGTVNKAPKAMEIKNGAYALVQ
ncbi:MULTISPECIES: ABC transporter substrate-binding protein [Suilimivivens]|uniref:ABC transporter substrate-binding protein n=1 Tax=Suilimivivens aceti TaxID=2981774 RepID=A0ABT2T345_9FIRM|nr:ABC transporter substrate-binding protein [Suilimivivens aceti]MCU6744653.1 ABC transporter substrate-binding protein [Suilimivivens aceti]